MHVLSTLSGLPGPGGRYLTHSTGRLPARVTPLQPPWEPQTNERYLSWDQSAQLKLLKLVLAEKMVSRRPHHTTDLKALHLQTHTLACAVGTSAAPALPLIPHAHYEQQQCCALRTAFGSQGSPRSLHSQIPRSPMRPYQHLVHIHARLMPASTIK